MTCSSYLQMTICHVLTKYSFIILINSSTHAWRSVTRTKQINILGVHSFIHSTRHDDSHGRYANESAVDWPMRVWEILRRAVSVSLQPIRAGRAEYSNEQGTPQCTAMRGEKLQNWCPNIVRPQEYEHPRLVLLG